MAQSLNELPYIKLTDSITHEHVNCAWKYMEYFMNPENTSK